MKEACHRKVTHLMYVHDVVKGESTRLHYATFGVRGNGANSEMNDSWFILV